MESDIKKAIISTLIRYHIEEVPGLSLFEIYKHLKTLDGYVSIANMHNTLNALSNQNSIKSKNGFYNIDSKKSYDDFFAKRILTSKISAKKINKAKKISRLLKTVPYIKSIAISGSVSMSGPKPKSDIDLFIITKKNRIWLTRIITVFLTHIIGQRRYKNKLNDRICLNLYVADENTVFPIQNIASANMIAKMLPLYNKDVFYGFLSANKDWLSKYISNFENNFIFLKKRNKPNTQKESKIITFVENLIGKILSKRIYRNTPTAKPPFLIVNKSSLVFYYPQSKNQEIMEKYEKAVVLYKDKI